MLPIHSLYYFVEVDKYQSISLAAESLHVTQPTLTVALKKLEQQLGKPLMTRTYKGMVTTEYGKEVVALAKQAISYLDAIEATSMQNKPDEVPLFSDIEVYATAAYSGMLLDSFLDKYTTQNQILQIQNMDPHANPHELLMNNEKAVFFGILPENTEMDSNIDCIRLKKSNSYIMFNKKNFPALANQSSISFQECVYLPFIAIRNGYQFAETLFGRLESYGTPHIIAIAPDYASCSMMVKKGIGICFTNKLTTVDDPEVMAIPIRQAPVFSLVLCYKKRENSDSIHALAELLKEHL